MKTFYHLIPGENGQESRLYIDGEIAPGESYTDWWGDSSVGSKTFRKALSQCREVAVYINSPGGDVFAAAEMYAALKDHPYRVVAKIMGVAASAASVVAMAADEVLINPVGYMIIHDPWSYVAGNAREMEKEARILREIGEGIVTAYQEKTGLERSEIERLLENETYMNAQSAIEMGFADGLWEFDRQAVAGASMPAATMSGRRYAPAAYMARLGKPEQPPRTESPAAGAEARARARALVRAALAALDD